MIISFHLDDKKALSDACNFGCKPIPPVKALDCFER